MAGKEVLFYIIVIIIVLVKLIFWSIYLCMRNRRRRLHRQRLVEERADAVETCYEEIPAVPQPAYIYSGMNPQELVHTALIDSLPGYQAEDPYKIDLPPPRYNATLHTSDTEPTSASSSNNELMTLADIDISDRDRLICSDGDEPDEFICLQQVR